MVVIGVEGGAWPVMVYRLMLVCSTLSPPGREGALWSVHCTLHVKNKNTLHVPVLLWYHADQAGPEVFRLEPEP